MNLPKKIISTEVPAVAPAFLGTQPFTTAAKKLLDDFVYLDDRPIFFFVSSCSLFRNSVCDKTPERRMSAGLSSGLLSPFSQTALQVRTH